MDDYRATPQSALLARPCYDYFEGAREFLDAYCSEIDALVVRLGLSNGPDFFAAYSTEKERWYGDDPVNPNEQGMAYMARLWHDAVQTAVRKHGAGAP